MGKQFANFANKAAGAACHSKLASCNADAVAVADAEMMAGQQPANKSGHVYHGFMRWRRLSRPPQG